MEQTEPNKKKAKNKPKKNKKDKTKTPDGNNEENKEGGEDHGTEQQKPKHKATVKINTDEKQSKKNRKYEVDKEMCDLGYWKFFEFRLKFTVLCMSDLE